MKIARAQLWAALMTAIVLSPEGTSAKRTPGSSQAAVREVNEVATPPADSVIAISGVTLIDGRGGPPIPNSTVLIRGNRIAAVGPQSRIRIPSGAQTVDGKGATLLPGLIDSHFHLERPDLPELALRHGVTSVRDPGQWIEAYEAKIKGTVPVPRLYLCGPHLDSPPPAYPADSFIVRDAEETRLAVARFADQGASAIKAYFRLPVDLIRVAVDTAHKRGIPVTTHLEIVDARDAIRAGVDGVEHVTSFGTALQPAREAEKFRQSVLADNNARREGRYKVWSTLDLDSPQATDLFRLIADRRVFVSPTLAVFERRAGDKETSSVHVSAFLKMLEFVGRAKKAGAHVVVGSHSIVPHAEPGWAYQREMELLVESGLSPMEAIVAGTLENARFFRIDKRLGSIEVGKQADLVMVDGDPSRDISVMRKIKRVMLNGVWIDSGAAKP